jgi:hypothetical protein
VALLHGGEAHVHPEDLPTHLAWWHWDVPVLLGLGVSALGYAFVAWWLWRTAGRFDRRAAAAWALGLLVAFVALESPLDAVAEENLISAHMLQHGLLMSVAPPLLLLGLYPRLVVPFSRPVLKPLLRNRRAHAALRVLSAPALVLGLWLTILYAWHLPAVYQSALRNETVGPTGGGADLGTGALPRLRLAGYALGPLAGGGPAARRARDDGRGHGRFVDSGGLDRLEVAGRSGAPGSAALAGRRVGGAVGTLPEKG